MAEYAGYTNPTGVPPSSNNAQMVQSYGKIAELDDRVTALENV